MYGKSYLSKRALWLHTVCSHLRFCQQHKKTEKNLKLQRYSSKFELQDRQLVSRSTNTRSDSTLLIQSFAAFLFCVSSYSSYQCSYLRQDLPRPQVPHLNLLLCVCSRPLSHLASSSANSFNSSIKSLTSERKYTYCHAWGIAQELGQTL